MTSVKDLHIISFNVPYPADYGGVIDVYFKLKALAKLGIRIHLHCYQYGRQESEQLEKLCHVVYYYKRGIFKDPFFSREPYIVATRNTSAILQNLLKDNYPILYEGLHCCHYLSHPDLKERIKVVRMHNIEHIYYRSLARIEKNIFKKYFFYSEASRLKSFENVLSHANYIAAISPDDTKNLDQKFENVMYLPAFHANDSVTASTGVGEFALYHGNLGIGENNEAALFLTREVFNTFDYPLIIAGKNPSRELRNAVEECQNINLLPNAGTDEISSLISQAHINILPTFQNTGMKLKLINVLFQGRHCIVNDAMVHHTGLEPLCHISNNPKEMRSIIMELKVIPFNSEEIDNRKSYLNTHFNNEKNAMGLARQMKLETTQKIEPLHVVK